MIQIGWRIATIKNGLQDALAYRSDFFIGLFTSAIVTAGIQLTIWYAAFKLGHVSSMGGQSYEQLIAYTAVSTLFAQIRGGNYDFTLDEMITSGTLSNYLLRPVGAVEFVYLRSVGEKSATTLLCTIVGLIACLFTNMQPMAFLWGMLLAILGNIIAYQIGALVCVVSFYWEQAFALLLVKNMLVNLLCGELLPLTLFPASWTPYWKIFPFYLFVFGPAQIALGHWIGNEIYLHLGIALAWAIGLNFVIKWSWGWAINRYQGIGG